MQDLLQEPNRTDVDLSPLQNFGLAVRFYVLEKTTPPREDGPRFGHAESVLVALKVHETIVDYLRQQYSPLPPEDRMMIYSIVPSILVDCAKLKDRICDPALLRKLIIDAIAYGSGKEPTTVAHELSLFEKNGKAPAPRPLDKTQCTL